MSKYRSSSHSAAPDPLVLRRLPRRQKNIDAIPCLSAGPLAIISFQSRRWSTSGRELPSTASRTGPWPTMRLADQRTPSRAPIKVSSEVPTANPEDGQRQVSAAALQGPNLNGSSQVWKSRSVQLLGSPANCRSKSFMPTGRHPMRCVSTTGCQLCWNEPSAIQQYLRGGDPEVRTARSFGGGLGQKKTTVSRVIDTNGAGYGV